MFCRARWMIRHRSDIRGVIGRFVQAYSECSRPHVALLYTDATGCVNVSWRRRPTCRGSEFFLRRKKKHSFSSAGLAFCESPFRLARREPCSRRDAPTLRRLAPRIRCSPPGKRIPSPGDPRAVRRRRDISICRNFLPRPRGRRMRAREFARGGQNFRE